MTKTQFLLFFLSIIPFVGVVAISMIGNYPKIVSFLTLVLSAIFLVNSFHLLTNYLHHSKDPLILFSMNRDINIGLAAEPISLIFLFLISIIWAGINFYSTKYFLMVNDKRIFPFQIFSTLVIGFITLIIFSKNLVSIFLFYEALIFCTYFFNSYFLHKHDIKASYNFTFLLLLSSFAFFLAMVFTYKLTGQVDFTPNGVINTNLSLSSYVVLLFLYLSGIVLIAFVPVYLMYGSLYYLSPPIMIMVFILSYGLVSLFILLKVITYIFGINLFLAYNSQVNYNYLITLVLTLNLFISAAASIFGKNLKKVLIYLFFNQLIFSILSLFVFKQQVYQAAIVMMAFILAQILIFFCIGNINIYLFVSKERTLNGIFYKLKLTTLLLIFALLGIIGVAPSIGMIEKYLLLKQIVKSRSVIDGLIILSNAILNIICVLKIIKPMLEKQPEDPNYNKENSSEIETNPSLMLPIILIASIMFLTFLFPSFIINFSKRVF